MAITTIQGGFYLPRPFYNVDIPAVVTGGSMTVANGKFAIMCRVPKSGNISKVVWRTGTVTTGATIDVRLETVDLATGFPSGTLVSTNSNASVVVNSTDDNIVFTTTLTASAVVTAGQYIASVFVNPGASFGSMNFGAMAADNINNFPTGATNNGATWTATAVTVYQMVAFEYDDGTYTYIQQVMPPYSAITTNTVNTGTTPDVWGLRFQLPISVRVHGAWLMMDQDGDSYVKLVTTAYNQGAGTGVLASCLIDATVRRSTSNAIAFVEWDSVTLSASTNYRLVVEPTSATSVILYDIAVASLARLDSFQGGQNFHLTTAKDPTADGSWTNYNSGTFRMPLMGLLIDGVDASGGAAATGGSYAFTG